MKYKILGWIGVVWGGLILASGLYQLFTGRIGGGAYGAGRLVGLLFGVLLLYAGLRALQAARAPSSK